MKNDINKEITAKSHNRSLVDLRHNSKRKFET